jgi:hypothetical protein
MSDNVTFSKEIDWTVRVNGVVVFSSFRKVKALELFERLVEAMKQGGQQQ